MLVIRLQSGIIHSAATAMKAHSQKIWAMATLWLLLVIAFNSAQAGGFDCARASLKVDFVICRSSEGRIAVDALSSAWADLWQRLEPSARDVVLAEQRKWVQSYAAACGASGPGRPEPDPSHKTDACVIREIHSRTDFLRSKAAQIAVPSSSISPPVAAKAAALPSDCAFRPTLIVDANVEVRAGNWFPIKWSRCAATVRLEEPTFLVIAVPDEVRLRGVGFYALRPKARAPFGLDMDMDRARIIIPLHQPFIPASGTIEVSPLLAGDLPIEAVVFRHEDGRNIVTWRSGPLTKRVTPGAPDVRVWQEAPAELPAEIRDSDNGQWELRIYPATYEVIDRKTGDLVVRRAGTDPVFSPTQRFLLANTPPLARVEIYDLVARRLVRKDLRNFLIWLHQDSIVLEDWGRYCNVFVISTLIDETKQVSDPGAGAGPGACFAWHDSKIDLDIDAGFIANNSDSTNGQNSGRPGVGSLTRLSAGDLDAEQSPAQAIALIRNRLSNTYTGPPHIWRLHDNIKLVSGDFDTGIGYETGRRYLMTASHVVSDRQVSASNGGIELREPITRGTGISYVQSSSLKCSKQPLRACWVHRWDQWSSQSAPQPSALRNKARMTMWASRGITHSLLRQY